MFKYNPTVIADPSDKIKFYILQERFDIAMMSSTKWESRARSWFIPIWPIAFLLWRRANTKARESINGMKEILSKYPEYETLRAVEK